MTIVCDLPGFDYPPFLIPQPDGTTFALWEEVTYTGTQGDSWVLPEGFRTDFATIPSIVSWAVAKLGAYTLAAIIHDLLCEGLNRWWRALQAFAAGEAFLENDLDTSWIVLADGTRVDPPTANAVDADAIFYKIARDHGTDPVTAALLYTGVRWGALANPARRDGFMRRDVFWKWLGLSLAFAPVLLPATVLAVVGRGVLRAVRWMLR
jgi:hypothetical protein